MITEFFKRFFEKTSWQIFAAVFTLLFTITGTIGSILDSNKTVATILRDAVAVDATTHQPQLKGWFIPIELLIWAVALALVMMVVWTIRRRFVQSEDQIAMEEFMSCVRKIMDQSKQDEVVKSWDSLTFIYLINKDFSGSLMRHLTIRAVDRPIHFWESVITATEESDPARSLADIKYRVQDLTGPPGNIVYLPSGSEKRKKKACLFFLPPIQPAETRELEVSFHWPGLFRRLKHSTEEFEFVSRSKETLGHYRLEIYLEDEVQGELKCEVTGPQHTGATFQTAKQLSLPGWKGSGYIYEVRGVPPGKARFVVTARIKR